MLAIPSRHRSAALLACVLTAQVLLLAVQIKRDRQVRLIRVWAVALVAPVQRTGAWMLDEVRGGWNHYIALRNTRKENEALRAELARLQLRNTELEGRAAEVDRLASLLAFRDSHDAASMVTARVISAGADAASKTIFIDRGQSDGVRRNMPVITPDGVVGKVLEVFKNTAQVQLLSERDAGAGALLASNRAQGVVIGTGEPSLQMWYVSNDEQVAVGERVLTSGLDRIYPKDLPVGTVTEVKPGKDFKQIRVQPAAHLDRLEEVLVLLPSKEAAATKEKTTGNPAAGVPAGPRQTPGKTTPPAKGPGQPQ